jgi:hypothetical protein
MCIKVRENHGSLKQEIFLARVMLQTPFSKSAIHGAVTKAEHRDRQEKVRVRAPHTYKYAFFFLPHCQLPACPYMALVVGWLCVLACVALRCASVRPSVRPPWLVVLGSFERDSVSFVCVCGPHMMMDAAPLPFFLLMTSSRHALLADDVLLSCLLCDLRHTKARASLDACIADMLHKFK